MARLSISRCKKNMLLKKNNKMQVAGENFWLVNIAYNYEPAFEILVHIALPSNEGSGKSANMGRLTRAFSARRHKVWM